MNKYIFIYNLLSSPAVILCSKCTLILSLETKFFKEHMQCQAQGPTHCYQKSFSTCCLPKTLFYPYLRISLVLLHISKSTLLMLGCPTDNFHILQSV